MEMKKVSDITYLDIANYIKIDVTNDNPLENELKTYLNVAKNFISNYTGIPESATDDNTETLDSYPDFIIVVLILCQDMYDNRTMYVDGKNINKVVQTILDMHVKVNIG